MTRRFVCFLLLLSVTARAEDAKARELVKRWIEQGAKAKTLEVEFVQERRLRALRVPLTKPGKIWFQRPESFRWQIGDPPVMIAVRKSGGELRVLDAKEKTLRVWTADELAAEAGNGKGHGFAMAGSGFPASIEAFEQMFEIDGAKETSTPGVWDVQLDLRDRKAGVFVKEIIFTVVPSDGSLRKFDIIMRDGSMTTTRVVAAKKNAVMAPSIFELNSAAN